MVIETAAGEIFRHLFQISGFPATFPDEYRWAGGHPIAHVSIDLEQDDCREIAQKLEATPAITPGSSGRSTRPPN